MFNTDVLPFVKHKNVLSGAVIDFHVILMMRLMDP